MQGEIDILENDILEKYPNVLEILLIDQTSQENIIWATDNYKNYGNNFQFSSQIMIESITGKNGHIIMPRIKKNKVLQQSRIKNMAEVFTPSWICNAQNNLIDNAWFNKENIFNTQFVRSNGKKFWKIKNEKITYPEGKTWKHYIRDTRLEIACGEAPYITSRYDTTSGEYIPIERRIGILDRKLRVINENSEVTGDWLEAAQTAYKNTYAFEWQGDSLLLAREAMLKTFIENFALKFGKEPQLKSIKNIAYIISWNVWQMDGLKAVIPNSCSPKVTYTQNLFSKIEENVTSCEGCLKNHIYKHNGIYSLIKDWKNLDPNTKKLGRPIKYVDLLKINKI